LGGFSYQWYRGENKILDATSINYLITGSDVGSEISVEVSYTDKDGTFEIVLSEKYLVSGQGKIELFQHASGEVWVLLETNFNDVVLFNYLLQKPSPPLTANAPFLPLDIVSFSAEIFEEGRSQLFSLFVEDSFPIDGYWVKNQSGSWVNLAQSVEHYSDGSLGVHFAITDGGEFDADGQANGVIVAEGGFGDGGRLPLELSDKVLALYIAYFSRAPDADGMSFWVAQAENGQSLYDISAGFANHPVFTQEYGGLGAREIVEKMYLNVLHREGDAGGIDFWVDKIDNQGQAVSQVFVDFAVGALEIDLEAYFGAGGLTSEEYTVAFERQKILENLMQASKHFLELFGDATIPVGLPDVVAETPAYQAAVAVLDAVDSDLNQVFDQRDALLPFVGQPDAMDQVLALLG
jgi:hypothetical protein